MTARYPVSFAQQRLWFLDQLMPGQAAYNIPLGIYLRGPLDADLLQAALDQVAGRHAVLRTSIVAVDGVPEQVVADAAAVTLDRIALPAGLNAQQRRRQAQLAAVALAERPFDLARGPLVRALLVRAAEDEHLLALVCHHVVGDAWSLQVLVREISECYRAAVRGERPALPPLGLQYGDYAVWQAERLSGEELDRQLGFWREHLRGAPAFLELPTVHSRPPILSYRGWLTNTVLPPSTVERLGGLARHRGATMFMVLLAAFEVVLSRYARQHEIVVATPVAGRTHAELDPMIGLFVNTLALRTSLAGDPTFAQVLGRVRASTADALSYQELPFEKLVEELSPERSLAHAPLCQVQFTYLPSEPELLDLPGIEAAEVPVFTATTKFDLSLYAEGQAGGEVVLAVEYNTDLFDLAWADRFLGCLVAVLGHAVEHPDTRIADLPLLSAAARDELLAGRNSRAATAPRHDHAGLLAALPGSASVVCGPDGDLPMAQVCAWAARIARVLSGHGVGPDVPVGLHVERGAGMLAAMLGVWWAGGAYVPLDPGLPPARLATIAEDAGVTVVLASSGTAEKSIVDGAVVVCLDGPAVSAAEPLPPAPLDGHCLAYLISTSGSTGRPKAVGVEHRQLANLLGSFARSVPIGGTDTFVAVTTLSFDIAVLELLLPVLRGARLVVAGAEQARDADQLRALIAARGGTAMQATPQTWRMLVASGGVPDSLRLRLCGGEALPRDLADELWSPATSLWNLYGPTETTVWSAAGVVPAGPAPVEIGPPIDNTRIYVLDEWQQLVPVDVVGEVYLAGHGVARGYHDRRRLTAQQFAPDPWSDEPGARMYRTGDLGRWRDGGGLELIGRTDHQVKIRGFRIECGEVEAALRTHPDVRQAAVVAVPRGADNHLVAYVVPRRRGAAARPGGDGAARAGGDLAELLAPHLRATLPDYMLPTLIVVLPGLPLTPSGKVDRAALPPPDWATAVPGERVRPRNPTEHALIRIWADLLDLSTPVGVHDSLFALGGHSITATRLVARVADAFGVNLPVHSVFVTPTIAELAVVIAAEQAAGRAAPAALHDRLTELNDADLDELVRAAQEIQRRRGAAAPAEP